MFLIAGWTNIFKILTLICSVTDLIIENIFLKITKKSSRIYESGQA